MPETRPINVYKDGVLVGTDGSFEVSDEELQAGKDDARIKAICAMGHSAIPLPILAEGFHLLCKRLGYG